MSKVIWHKAHHRRRRMVESYSPGGGNVSSHEGTLVTPGEYDWTCASFSPPEFTTQTTNRLVKPFLHSRQKVPIVYSGRPIHQNCPFPWGDLDPHLTHDSLGPCEPTTQTAHQLVPPFLHRRLQCPYTLECFACFPSKLPLPMGGSGPYVIHDSLGPPKSSTQMATWSLQPFLQGSLVWQTDRPTDHATQLITNRPHLRMLYCDAAS